MAPATKNSGQCGFSALIRLNLRHVFIVWLPCDLAHVIYHRQCFDHIAQNPGEEVSVNARVQVDAKADFAGGHRLAGAFLLTAFFAGATFLAAAGPG